MSERLAVDGIELAYEIYGDGEPLLLLHGMGGRGADWIHAGRDELSRHYRLIVPDLRNHGDSTGRFTYADAARDLVALLDALALPRVKAVGMSMGGNTLLHVATRARDRIDAMVLVSATMYYPAEARALMRQVPEGSSPQWELQRAQAEVYDDLAFTPPQLARIAARTLIIYGDRDPLYPVEMAVQMYRAIPRASLCVVPDAGHGPIFLGQARDAFVRHTLDFFRNVA
jgi:pimeloyl-ACP methyl ester carboxylesterase